MNAKLSEFGGRDALLGDQNPRAPEQIDPLAESKAARRHRDVQGA